MERPESARFSLRQRREPGVDGESEQTLGHLVNQPAGVYQCLWHHSALGRSIGIDGRPDERWGSCGFAQLLPAGPGSPKENRTDVGPAVQTMRSQSGELFLGTVDNFPQ